MHKTDKAVSNRDICKCLLYHLSHSTMNFTLLVYGVSQRLLAIVLVCKTQGNNVASIISDWFELLVTWPKPSTHLQLGVWDINRTLIHKTELSRCNLTTWLPCHSLLTFKDILTLNLHHTHKNESFPLYYYRYLA